MMLEKDYIETKMRDLAKLINYEYEDISYLSKAMHCRSIGKQNYTNSAWATLGDALLKFVLTEYLFDKGYDRAKISIQKQPWECNDTLYRICHKSGVFRYAYNVSYFYSEAPEGSQLPHGNHDIYIEAIIGAIYKDKGMEYCKKWCIRFLQEHQIID